MPNQPPAITGRQLIKLLTLDGWDDCGKRTHGIAFRKKDSSGRMRITVVPNKRGSLPVGTLKDILGPDQSNLGRDGLLRLIELHGLK